MIHEVFAPGMHNRAYYHRCTDDNVDLCDVLSSFSYGAKVKLDELSRIMGLAHSPIATSSSATVERASLTSTWPRRFIGVDDKIIGPLQRREQRRRARAVMPHGNPGDD